MMNDRVSYWPKLKVEIVAFTKQFYNFSYEILNVGLFFRDSAKFGKTPIR